MSLLLVEMTRDRRFFRRRLIDRKPSQKKKKDKTPKQTERTHRSHTKRTEKRIETKHNNNAIESLVRERRPNCRR
jgi:hypothetical protein